MTQSSSRSSRAVASWLHPLGAIDDRRAVSQSVSLSLVTVREVSTIIGAKKFFSLFTGVDSTKASAQIAYLTSLAWLLAVNWDLTTQYNDIIHVLYFFVYERNRLFFVTALIVLLC